MPQTTALPSQATQYRYEGRGRPLKVLHIIAPARVGGLESMVCTLVPGQNTAGMEARVVAVVDPDAEEHPVVATLRESDVEVDVVSVPGRSYSSERRRIASACKRWAPDVVHTHGYRTDLIDAPVARGLSIPCVSTFHGFTAGDLRNRLYEWLDRRAARSMDAVVAVSRPLGDRLKDVGVSHERLHVVPNAYSSRTEFVERAAARRALGLPRDAFAVGWIGRLTPEKGADVLIDAISFIEGQEIMACLIGDGSDRARLESRTASRAPGRVRFMGLVPDAARLLRGFDVFVLSSRTEGTPIVLFEAMDAGIPIVATRVGGVPDVLRPQDALLVEPENPLALAAGIYDIATDRSSAIERARSARSRLITDYAVEPWVEKYHDIYRQVVRRTAR